MAESSPQIAFFVGTFGGGGIERITAHLIHQLVKLGLRIDLVLNRGDRTHLWKLPAETRVIDLETPRLSMCVPKLAKYLRQEQPFALVASDHYLNEVALLAGRLSGAATKIVVAEHNQLSKTARSSSKFKARLAPILAHFLYPWADAIVAVSRGVAEDLAKTASLPINTIETIYNPVINPDMFTAAQESVDHPWFQEDIPIILGVGKLEAQKDFPTLIRAFAKVRQQTAARLMILGWGPDRPELDALIQELDLQEDIDLPGYVQNPYAYMARAAVFALSSAWEGLPTVLIEAMALNIPVVSTNCESGPEEILAGGKYGYLTPVGDSDAFANAILKVLAGGQKLIESSWLEQFGLEASTQKYLKVLGIPAMESVISTRS